MSFNIYEAVTDRILAQLEAGTIPWRKPWTGSAPINYITRKPYRGINAMLLDDGEYLTYKQAKDCGGQVRKGEKSSMIVFYKMMESKDEKTQETKKFPYLQYSNVFHISQCDGIESKIKSNDNIAEPREPIDIAEDIIADYVNREHVELNIVDGSNQAYYMPSNDSVTLPMLKQFNSTNEYYSVAFHELAHSTGHPSRLNRIKNVAAFGSENYSKEELCAEITSAFIMNTAGIEIPETFENSAAYIKSWSRKLKEDVKMIVSAAGQASKASDLILGLA